MMAGKRELQKKHSAGSTQQSAISTQQSAISINVRGCFFEWGRVVLVSSHAASRRQGIGPRPAPNDPLAESTDEANADC
jgi:hypothetical protein